MSLDRENRELRQQVARLQYELERYRAAAAEARTHANALDLQALLPKIENLPTSERQGGDAPTDLGFAPDSSAAADASASPPTPPPTAALEDDTIAGFDAREVGVDDSEQLFRAYIETANDMVYTVDLNGALTFMNPYGQRLLGCPKSQWYGRSYLDFVAVEDRERTARAFANLLHTGELKDFEFVLHPENGRRIYMEVNGRLLYRNGQLIGGLGIARDVTERKQFERQLQMFLKAVESAYDSTAIVDLNGCIAYANPAADRMFECPLAELVGQNAATFFPEDARASTDWLIRRAVEGGWSGEVICQRKNGDRFPALISVGPVPAENGQLSAISIVCRDITGQKEIQAELAAKNIELERASRLKSEFLANMSHELRTPLTSILGFSSLLQQQIFGPLNPKQMVYVQRLHHSGEHLLNLISDVLDLSKVEAGKVKLDMGPVSIAQLCEESLALVSEQARSRGLEIRTKVPKQLGMLMADELRVRQMLLNLLSNAIKFSPEGGEIGLEAEVNAGYLHLSVWDNGIGIPEDKQKLLFQPFQQLDSSLERRHQGTGLGLALTRQFAELHGGSIRCQSTEGEGSCFTISLPLNLYRSGAAGEEEDAESQVSSEVKAAGTSASVRLLLVEDHQYNAMLLQDILQHWGYEVECARDGYQALEWLSQNQPDLILMDVHLPGINGLDLTRRIKANPRWSEIPVVATTALAMVGDRERCLAAGMEEYLSKPVDCDRLAAVIERFAGVPPDAPSPVRRTTRPSEAIGIEETDEGEAASATEDVQSNGSSVR